MGGELRDVPRDNEISGAIPPLTLTQSDASSLISSLQVYEEARSLYLQYNIEQAGLNTSPGYSEFIPAARTNVTVSLDDDKFLVSTGAASPMAFSLGGSVSVLISAL